MGKLYPWQQMVMDLIAEPMNSDLRRQMKEIMSPGAFNKNHGVYMSMGRRAGHTTLAAHIVNTFPGAIAIAPNERMRDLLQKQVKNDHHRVVMARFPDTQMKFNVINRVEPPFDTAEICVVDGASLLTEWELAPIRCAQWDFYIELA